MYKIIRFYFNGRPRTIKRGLTMDEVQAYLASPETSSRTATSWRARQRTKAKGPWFCGYDHDR